MEKLIFESVRMKKKELTKFLLRGVSIFGLILIITGCSSKGTDSDSTNMVGGDENIHMQKSIDSNENDTDYQNAVTDIKVSDFFYKGERRLWFYIHDLAYDKDISAIYVIEKGNIKTYKFYNGRGTAQWQPTLEDLDGKSDDEIIEFIEEKKEPIKEPLEISYSRDFTGNKIEEETIHIGTGILSLNFEIGNILNLETILSNQFLGFRSDEGTYLVTKYNFETETKIILNEIGDEGIVEH